MRLHVDRKRALQRRQVQSLIGTRETNYLCGGNCKTSIHVIDWQTIYVLKKPLMGILHILSSKVP